MSKDDKRAIETDDKPAPPAMLESLPFTIKIISQDGKHYYKLESRQLGIEREITDPHMLEMVNKRIRLDHQANQPTAMFAGTFIVNLSALKE